MKYILIEDVKTHQEEDAQVWLDFYLENGESFAIPSQQDLTQFMRTEDVNKRLDLSKTLAFCIANEKFFGAIQRLIISFNDDTSKIIGYIEFEHSERLIYTLKCDVYELLKMRFLFNHPLFIDTTSWEITHAYLSKKQIEEGSLEKRLEVMKAQLDTFLKDEDYNKAAEVRDEIDDLKKQYALHLVTAIGASKNP